MGWIILGVVAFMAVVRFIVRGWVEEDVRAVGPRVQLDPPPGKPPVIVVRERRELGQRLLGARSDR